MKQLNNLIALSVLFCVSAGSVNALQSDSQQPINLTADRAEMDDSKGISTYTGSVKLIQGSLTLTGERLIVETVDGATEMITNRKTSVQTTR